MNAEENDILQIYFNQVNTKEFSDRDMIINNSLLKSKIKRLVYINELDKYEFVNEERKKTCNFYWSTFSLPKLAKISFSKVQV